MFGRDKNRGVKLDIAGQTLRATSVPEFDAALSPLSAVSAQRLTELGEYNDKALKLNDQELSKLISQLSTSLNTNDEIAQSARLIQSLGGVHLPWSKAFSSASQWTDDQRPFRQSLLKAYIQYCSNEQVCMHTLLANRKRQQPKRDSNQKSASTPRQRLIFTPIALGLDIKGQGDLALARLGKGNTAELQMQPGQSTTLMLSRHLFLVVCGDPWLLIDSHGDDMQLQPGRNLIGRSNDCDVAVNERYFAVSRRHVLLETESSDLLTVTDLSSLGTFIPQANTRKHFH